MQNIQGIPVSAKRVFSGKVSARQSDNHTNAVGRGGRRYVLTTFAAVDQHCTGRSDVLTAL
ncbi:hypothetical protein IMCC26134_14920 [Verrucomicrobia bacterium IMCC26134]|nr:hypothetical protein IMCC26134_14920 [Verrucomicrobia bacterium IMCC26134]